MHGRGAQIEPANRFVATRREDDWEQLAADDEFQIERSSDTLDPLPRFAVRPDQQRVVASVERGGQQRRRGDTRRFHPRHDRGERTGPVEMWIQRQQAVEMVGQQLAHHPLAYRLAVMERDILPHVGEIGRDQDDLGRPVGAQRGHRQQQLDQLVVRMIERAIQERSFRRRLDSNQALAVRKPVHRHRPAWHAERLRQPLRRRPGGEREYAAAHAVTS